MKPINFYFLIFIFFGLVKISLLEEEEELDPYSKYIDFIVIGLENYKEDNARITFKALFMNLSNKAMTNFFKFFANITYLTKSTVPNSYAIELKNGNCTNENTKLNDDYIYLI